LSKQTVPPARFLWVSIRLMSPMHTYDAMFLWRPEMVPFLTVIHTYFPVLLNFITFRPKLIHKIDSCGQWKYGYFSAWIAVIWNTLKFLII
jgi:hypothetical protein